MRTRSRQPRHNGVRKGRQPQIMATSISSIVQIDSRALEAVLSVRFPEEFDRRLNKNVKDPYRPGLWLGNIGTVQA